MGNDKLEPHNIEAEKSVLGGVLVDAAACSDAFDKLSPIDFYNPVHGTIFDHALQIWKAGGVPDAITVADGLTKAGLIDSIGGPSALVSLLSSAAMRSTFGRHVDIVKDASTRRRLMVAAANISELAKHSALPIAELSIEAEKTLLGVTAVEAHDSRLAFANVSEALSEIGEMWMHWKALRGISTGLRDLDTFISGLEREKLYIIAARPGNGKTALALNIGSHVAASEGLPVLFFSLEMGETEINHRLMASLSKVSLNRLEKGLLTQHDWTRIVDASKVLNDSKFLIDDDSTVTVDALYSRCRQAQATYGQLGLVVVDYIQLMGGEGENRQLEISYISRKLKILSKEFNVPVIGLSQLSRKVEERSSKKPLLSDLRESGSLEQDSNVVMFIYRPELYEPNSEFAGMPELIIAKQRSGPTGSVRLAFVDTQTRFASLSKEA